VAAVSDSTARTLDVEDVLAGGRVWCPECRQVQPLVLDRLASGGALDLVCGHCHVVIATLHQKEVLSC